MSITKSSELQEVDLSRAVCVVTGGAKGIGAATVRELHKSGARIGIFDIDINAAQELSKELGDSRTLAVKVDVTDPDSIVSACDAVRERFGTITVAMANAGISSGDKCYTISGAPDGVFNKVLDVNLFGVWNTVRAVISDIRKSHGHIVMTSSTYAYMNGMANSPYACSKAAVEQMGRALRAELAYVPATAGILYPGWVETDIAKVAYGGDDLATELVHHATPSLLSKQISPHVVGKAVAEGIRRRKRSIQVPKRWRVYFALRGVVNPISDYILENDAFVHDRIKKADERSGVRKYPEE